MARINLLLFGHITAAVYLLEHAQWANATRESDAHVHVATFRAWISDHNLTSLLDQHKRNDAASQIKPEIDYELVYGPTRNLAKL